MGKQAGRGFFVVTDAYLGRLSGEVKMLLWRRSLDVEVDCVREEAIEALVVSFRLLLDGAKNAESPTAKL